MRTIKRKRIFGGRKSIHKKKHKRSLKKFRGGVELNYLQDIEIYNVKGILGYQKPGPLYKGEEKYKTLDIIKETDIPTTPNLFKGNIKHDNGNVILTDYKPLKSIKIGWIYGGHFGNIVIYSSNDKLTEVIYKLNDYIFKKDAQIKKTLFVREIDEEVIKFCERKKELINEISPWESLTQEFDFTENDLNETNIDSMFKSLLEKYYSEKIDGISKEKIKLLLETVDNPDIETIRTDDTLLGEYKEILQRRNKSFVKEFTTENIGGDLGETTWGEKVDQGPPAQGKYYPEIYKKINALRLKQEIIYKELTDIFSTYERYTYPFNIKYFSCNIQPPQKSDKLIKDIIEKFNNNILKFNNRTHKSISKIMYILQYFNQTNKIYRNTENVVRYKQIPKADYDKEPTNKDGLFNLEKDMNGFRDFTNGYVINSLIDPVIMARLLSFNIQIKATILLSYSNDTGKKLYVNNGEDFHELTQLDLNQEKGLYEKIDDDEKRLKIKRLKINEKEITSEDLEAAKQTGADQSKLVDFTTVLNTDGDIGKDIECELKNPQAKKSEDEILELNCKCKIYKKETGDVTDIMIYLYDNNTRFNHELIKNILIKPNYNDSIYDVINNDYLDNFDNHLFDNDNGHEHNYYDLIL